MTDDDIKAAVTKFMQHVNFTAQRELEKALRRAAATGKIKPHDDLTTTVTLSSEKVGLNVTIHSRIVL